MQATSDNLNSLVEFYCPFIVTPEGVESAQGVYVPNVYYDDETDIYIESHEWEALTGYTGQYSYNGAVLHPSEYLGGGLLEDILEDVGGTYALVPVEDLDDSELVGWTVLRKLK